MNVFANNDAILLQRVEAAREERRKSNRQGLTGGLEAVVVNVHPEHLKATVAEYLRFTGLRFQEAFEDPAFTTCVLTAPGSADFLIRSRKTGENPFVPFNQGPKSAHLPHARLESFIFKGFDLELYAALQQERGQAFMRPCVIREEGYSFIQTPPSEYTGNSLGFVQWKGRERQWRTQSGKALDWTFEKPDLPHLRNIHALDHSATRVHAAHRDDAIIEFMGLTDYDFDFAVYVESLNSITNVARLGPNEYAQVFTSGISPFTTVEASGPTEKFIHNYGLRVHHLAFSCTEIEETYDALAHDGMRFLVELVGSREEGLRQTFSEMSPHTFLVNEYIQRYDGFDGFFTRSNVTELTRATDKQ